MPQQCTMPQSMTAPIVTPIATIALLGPATPVLSPTLVTSASGTPASDPVASGLPPENTSPFEAQAVTEAQTVTDLQAPVDTTPLAIGSLEALLTDLQAPVDATPVDTTPLSIGALEASLEASPGWLGFQVGIKSAPTHIPTSIVQACARTARIDKIWLSRLRPRGVSRPSTKEVTAKKTVSAPSTVPRKCTWHGRLRPRPARKSGKSQKEFFAKQKRRALDQEQCSTPTLAPAPGHFDFKATKELQLLAFGCHNSRARPLQLRQSDRIHRMAKVSRRLHFTC